MTTRTSEMEHETHVNGRSSIGTVKAAITDRMPSNLDDAGDAMSDAVRAVRTSVAGAPDENVLLAASLAAGMSIGLLVGGAPRLLAAGTLAAAVALGATLLGRRPGATRRPGASAA